MVDAPEQPRLSIMEQAQFVHDLITRCLMRDGVPAGEAMLLLDRQAIVNLTHLAERLALLAPLEPAIRKLVKK
jgi:hypothetical protein